MHRGKGGGVAREEPRLDPLLRWNSRDFGAPLRSSHLGRKSQRVGRRQPHRVVELSIRRREDAHAHDSWGRSRCQYHQQPRGREPLQLGLPDLAELPGRRLKARWTGVRHRGFGVVVHLRRGHGWQLQRTTTSINAATAGDTAAEELASQRRRSNVKRWIDKVAGTNRMACRAQDQRSVTNT